MGVPRGYRTYQRIAWTDMMNDRKRGRLFEGPPTVSNVEAHIIEASRRGLRDFDIEEDLDFRVRCSDFRKRVLGKYVCEQDRGIKLTSENSRAVGDHFYYRDRIEPLIEVNRKGYKRYAYMYFVNENTKKVIKQYDIDGSDYSYSTIVMPAWRSGTGVKLHFGTENVYRLKEDTIDNLTMKAQEILEVDKEKVKSKVDKISDEEINRYETL